MHNNTNSTLLCIQKECWKEYLSWSAASQIKNCLPYSTWGGAGHSRHKNINALKNYFVLNSAIKRQFQNPSKKTITRLLPVSVSKSARTSSIFIALGMTRLRKIFRVQWVYSGRTKIAIHINTFCICMKSDFFVPFLVATWYLRDILQGPGVSKLWVPIGNGLGYYCKVGVRRPAFSWLWTTNLAGCSTPLSWYFY